jgi:hypothetical protein
MEKEIEALKLQLQLKEEENRRLKDLLVYFKFSNLEKEFFCKP